MSFFSRYIEYLKDNPEGYWFKRKLYGWGWTPATREGWAVTILYLIAVIAFVFTIDETSPLREIFFTFFLPIILLTFTLILIVYRKGEPARWQWGFPKEEKKTEPKGDNLSN